MGDFDDMNATPLGKLPMPVVQSKADGPSIDARSSTYEDILKDMRDPGSGSGQAPEFPGKERFTGGGQGGQGGQGGLGGQFNPRQLQQLQHSPAELQLQLQLQQQLQQQQQQQLQQQLQQQHHQPQQQLLPQQLQFATKAGRPKASQRHQRHGSVLSVLSHYKSTLIVIGIVVLVLTYVAPRLSRGVPRLLDPATARFNAAGIAVLSLVCGGLFRAVDRAVGHYF